MNITEYIQKYILGNLSADVRMKLDEHLSVIAEDVYSFHTWRWLIKSDTVTLVTDTIEYNLAGSNTDLAKVHAMFYGADMAPLKDEYPNEKAFYANLFGSTGEGTPTHFVPKEKVSENTWRYIIYPCGATTLEDISYRYKKVFNIGDISLYPNPMVFILGVLSLYYAGIAAYTKDSAQAVKLISLADRYMVKYDARMERMKQEDSPVTHPKSRIDISNEQKAQVLTSRRLANLRER